MRPTAVVTVGGAGGTIMASLGSRPLSAALVALISLGSLLVTALLEQAAHRSRERRERALLTALAASLQTGVAVPYLAEAIRALNPGAQAGPLGGGTHPGHLRGSEMLERLHEPPMRERGAGRAGPRPCQPAG